MLKGDVAWNKILTDHELSKTSSTNNLSLPRLISTPCARNNQQSVQVENLQISSYPRLQTGVLTWVQKDRSS